MNKNIFSVRLCLTGVVLVMAFFFTGCSIFNSVGNSISLGYENMVTYFNGYYNARILFSDAEDEMKTAALLTRGKEIPAAQANQIPASAKQKFGQVIDKCSNILAFHPTSSLVDNALFLIGKSFFYQMEYLKAERKFIELLAQFPNSSLALEAQLWFARTEEKLGKFNDGIHLSDAVVAAAQTTHENEIETQAHQLLGLIYRRMNETDKSIAEYEKVISISTNDAAKGDAQISLGDIYFLDGQYKKAAEVYLKTEDYTSDIYSNYYSKLQASIAYRVIGEQKKELTLLNAMIDDFRNKEYLAAILFERANNYDGSGKRDDAINAYIVIDTTYAHTEYAVRSAFQLGLIFEKELGLYSRALKYYTEVNTATGSSVGKEGHRKFIGLTRYFDAWHRLNLADSLLLVLSDTTHKIVHDTLSTVATDSTHQKEGQVNSLAGKSNFDSLKAKSTIPDTTQRKPVQAAVPPVLLNADSLRVLKSIAAQELGDVFYSEVVEPDSAFYWYNKSLLWSYDHSRSPRILYALAELSRTNPEKKYPPPEEYHTRLDHDFPESVYAEEARRFLRKESSAVKKDTALEFYIQSEKQIDAKEYKTAIETLNSIIQSFPKSPLASKSEYAIGWIMENRLGQPDSAIVHYKRVTKNYQGTKYAQAVLKRDVDVQQPDTAKTDSVNTKNNPSIQKPFSPDSLQRNLKGLEKDTMKAKIIPPIQKVMRQDSLQNNLKGSEKDTVKAKIIPPIQKVMRQDSLQNNLKGSEKDTVNSLPVSPQDEKEKGTGKKTESKSKVLDKE